MTAASFVGVRPALASLSREDWLIFATSFALHAVVYFGFRSSTPGYPRTAAATTKTTTTTAAAEATAATKPAKRCDGWLPSLVCSGGLSMAGLYAHYIGMQAGYSEEWFSSESPLTRVALLHFFAFLVYDLVVGAIAYTSQLDILSGWVHHVIYLWIVLEALGHGSSNVLAIHFGSEIPTFVLAVGKLGIYRHDMLFGSSFFVTRIAVHLVNVLWQMKFDKDSIPRKYIFMCVIALALHVHWFRAWCIGMRKRALRNKKKD